MKTILFHLLILLSATGVRALDAGVRAQENLDSLKKIWRDPKYPVEQRFAAINQFYVLNTFSDPLTSKEAAKFHLALADQKKDLRQIIKANNEFAIIHTLLGKPDSALLFIEESINMAEQLNDSTQLATLFMNHGNVLSSIGQLRDGVNRYFESLYIFEKLQVKPLYQAHINHNLGIIYFNLGLDEIAQSYFKKALNRYQQVKGSEAIGQIWLSLSKTNYNLGSTNEAKSALKQAIAMLKDEPNLSTLSSAYLMAAFIYEEEKQLDSARHFNDLATKIRKEIGNENTILEALIQSIYLSIKADTPVTQEEKNTLARLVKSSTDLKIKANGCRLLHLLYKKEENHFSALEMIELYVKLSDSLLLKRDKVALIREELQSDFDNKILNVQLENERKNAVHELKHLKRLFLIISVSILVFLTLFLCVKRRFKAIALEKSLLLQEIDALKNTGMNNKAELMTSFQLNREKIEHYLDKKLNETDWSVLCCLLEDPVVSNKALASRVFLSVDGVGSSLRRMYEMFDVTESKYMKIGLLLKVIKISNA